MADYLGILIAQSLAKPSVLREFTVVARKPVGSWEFLLVSVPEEQLECHLRAVQGALRKNEPWYAHYFRNDDLVVVFQDATFHVGLDPSTWGPAVEHGVGRTIPREQLDFGPTTRADAYRFFGLPDLDD